MSLGVWAELMDDDAVARTLVDLAAAGSRLHLALDLERIGERSFADLTRRAADAGVPVFAWPLLPKELGYWIGKFNAEQARDAFDRIAGWQAERAGPALTGISVDLEPRFDFSERLRGLGGRIDRLLTELAGNLNRLRFDAARSTLAGAIDRLHSARLRVHAVTYPLILDAPAEDTTLEDALDIVLSGIEWDEVSFMVYQTAFAELGGSWFGPRLVHEYARDAFARFGDRAGIDLGVVGDRGVGLGPGNRYRAPSDLAGDVAAALAAGIPMDRMRVYGLDGIVHEGKIPGWICPPVPDAGAPEPSSLVTGLRNGVRGVATALRATRKD